MYGGAKRYTLYLGYTLPDLRKVTLYLGTACTFRQSIPRPAIDRRRNHHTRVDKLS